MTSWERRGGVQEVRRRGRVICDGFVDSSEIARSGRRLSRSGMPKRLRWCTRAYKVSSCSCSSDVLMQYAHLRAIWSSNSSFMVRYVPLLCIAARYAFLCLLKRWCASESAEGQLIRACWMRRDLPKATIGHSEESEKQSEWVQHV